MIDPRPAGRIRITHESGPFIVVSHDEKRLAFAPGRLALRDIAADDVERAGHSLPADMTGTDLRITS